MCICIDKATSMKPACWRKGGEGRGEERGKGGNDNFASFLPLFAEKGDVFSNSMPINLLSEGGCTRE